MLSQGSVTRAVGALSKSDVKSEAEKTPIGDVDEFKTPHKKDLYYDLKRVGPVVARWESATAENAQTECRTPTAASRPG